MRFVEKITPPDFQAKNFTPLISQNFNSLGDKNIKNVPAVTAVTNLTSALCLQVLSPYACTF